MKELTLLLWCVCLLQALSCARGKCRIPGEKHFMWLQRPGFAPIVPVGTGLLSTPIFSSMCWRIQKGMETSCIQRGEPKDTDLGECSWGGMQPGLSAHTEKPKPCQEPAPKPAYPRKLDHGPKQRPRSVRTSVRA